VGEAHVMRDFTLVIPTHNRAQLFAALLSYLESEKADCRILVLDSSRPEVLVANRTRVAASGLDIEFAEFPDLAVEKKWHQGVDKVSTPFCALCADDDLVVLEGVRQCLDALGGNAAASVVQGHSFTFLPRPDGDMELSNIVYFSPSIDDGSPLARLDTLFQQYQAPTYGMYRTAALQRVFAALEPMTKILPRELMWSALAAIEGQVVRLPVFSYGRNMGPSAAYEHWHPLEWFCKNPDGLFAEYLRYREYIVAAVIQRPDNMHKPEEIRGVLDVIHLRYLAKHAPDSSLKFIVDQQMAGIDFAEYWPRHEIHLPLYEAAGIGASQPAESLGSVNMRGRERSYILSPSFYAPRRADPPKVDSVVRLIGVLDGYRLAVDENIGATAEK
jgi:glycosyltransferase domain-containing protein